MSLPENQRQIIYYSMLGPCCVSTFGCVLILLMFFRFRTLRNNSFKMIGILSTIDLINSIAFMIPTYSTNNHSASCIIQGALVNFSTLGSVIWTTFMACVVYNSLKHSQDLQERTVLKGFICLLSFCIICTVIPFVVQGNTYGKTQGWCWIEDKYEYVRDCLLFGPVLVLIPFNFFVYVKIRRLINTILVGVENEEFKSKMKTKMIFYPLIIVACYFPYTFKALTEKFIPAVGGFEFTLIAGVVRNFHGFLNFLIYGLNSTVQKKLKEYWNHKVYNESLVSDVSDLTNISLRNGLKAV